MQSILKSPSSVFQQNTSTKKPGGGITKVNRHKNWKEIVLIFVRVRFRIYRNCTHNSALELIVRFYLTEQCLLRRYR